MSNGLSFYPLAFGLACQGADKKSGDTGGASTPFEVISWPVELPELTDLNRDWTDYRAIVHLHSHHSHDACDGEPQPDGVPDEDCLSDLRDGLCANRIDVAFMSEHPTHATEGAFSDLLLNRGNDELVTNSVGEPIGNWLNCDSGHRSLILPGIESSAMMPLGLERHMDEGYGGNTAEAFQGIRDAGGLAWIAHTEQRTAEELADLQVDGLELYQLHANLDPDIRRDFLDLDAFGYLEDVQPFFFSDEEDPPHPDLAPLGFLAPITPAIDTFENLGLYQPIAISGGTDAHQNVFPLDASDGDRIDSYRRMMRWFNTRLRIRGELGLVEAKDALRNGRSWIVFEVFGTPLGFDFYASQEEMGSEFSLGGQTLSVDLPVLDPRSPRAETKPVIEGRLYRFDADGREELLRWTQDSVEIQLDKAGVYRLEVWIQPLHLSPYLGTLAEEYSTRLVPWIYSGGIFVR